MAWIVQPASGKATADGAATLPEEPIVQRRWLMKTGLGLGTGALARPAIAQGERARTLRFIPQSDLANFDPIWTTQFVVRNAGAMVWDTLYGVDSTLQPRRQMVENEQVSADGLQWTFRLRDALRFHDGTPVLARDVVASLVRWCARDPMGQMLRALQVELSAPDDRTIRWYLRQPYPKMLLALGKASGPIAFIMPERIAQTDPFQQIREFIGSGPYRFVRDEWLPGARAVFTRFDGYAPRAERPDWLAGGKYALLDRVEWNVVPDPATAAAALQSGEVDWWESPITDLIPSLRANRAIQLEVADPLGYLGALRMNHTLPPFDDVRARQAVLMGLDQTDCMRALVGDDTNLWKQLGGYFTPGTPLYTEAGSTVLTGPRDLDAARRLLAGSSYRGEPVVMLVAQDQPIVKAFGDVTSDALRKLGFNVQYTAVDWGTVGSRRTSRAPVSQGGWNIFFSWFGGVDCLNPAAYVALRANGDGAWFGWPRSPAVERARDEWFAATDEAGAKAAADKMNAAAAADAVFAPTGFFLAHQAWRRTVTGIQKAPLPIFWGVSRT